MSIPSNWGNSLFNIWFQIAWIFYTYKNKINSYFNIYIQIKLKSIKHQVRPKTGKLLKYRRAY